MHVPSLKSMLVTIDIICSRLQEPDRGQEPPNPVKLLCDSRFVRHAKKLAHVTDGNPHIVGFWPEPCEPPGLVCGLRLIPSTGVYLGLYLHDFRALYATRTNNLACFWPKIQDSRLLTRIRARAARKYQECSVLPYESTEYPR